MCSSGTVIPMAQFDFPGPPEQHTLTEFLHANFRKEFTDGTCTIQLFRASMSFPESKARPVCQPTKAIGAYIPNCEFRPWGQFYWQIPLQPGKIFPRRNCGCVMDGFGDRLLHREHEPYRIQRHDSQVQLFAANLSKAARHPIVEPRRTGERRRRPDFKAL